MLLLAAFWVAATAQAQDVPAGDVFEDYARLLQIDGTVPAGSFFLRPVPFAVLYGDSAVTRIHPWQHRLQAYRRGEVGTVRAGLYDPEVIAFWNSSRPFGWNDGAAWQGRGVTAALEAGGFLSVGPLTVSLRPLIVYHQNRAFDLSPLPVPDSISQYGRPSFHPDATVSIDLPQRFGPDPFWTSDLGDSYVRLDWQGARLGISNQSRWWGPGMRNGIILTNNAPGFPHAFAGTSRPLDVYVGHLEILLMGGFVTESSYFDDDEGNDRRYLTGMMVALQPRPLPGLYLGLAQTRMAAGEEEEEEVEEEALGGRSDEMVSVFGRWVLADSGFEVYTEWSRDVYPESISDLLIVPEFSSAFVVGLQKVLPLSSANFVRIAAEVTKLEQNKARVEDRAVFYMHDGVAQGYTHRGQVLGAGIGPGSKEESLSVDWFRPEGRFGLTAFRLVYDNDRYYVRPNANNYEHEVEIGGGIHGDLFFGSWEANASITVGRLLNQNYTFKNDHSNVHVTFGFRKSLMGYR